MKFLLEGLSPHSLGYCHGQGVRKKDVIAAPFTAWTSLTRFNTPRHWTVVRTSGSLLELLHPCIQDRRNREWGRHNAEPLENSRQSFQHFTARHQAAVLPAEMH